jgi:hypothetical protein
MFENARAICIYVPRPAMQLQCTTRDPNRINIRDHRTLQRNLVMHSVVKSGPQGLKK